MRVDKDFLADIAGQMSIRQPVRLKEVSKYCSPELKSVLTGAIAEIYSGQNCKVMLDSYSVQIAMDCGFYSPSHFSSAFKMSSGLAREPFREIIKSPFTERGAARRMAYRRSQ